MSAAEPSTPQRVDPSRRILVVTDNRFWRSSMGSQVRIGALVAHLRQQGHAVRVAFVGALSPRDIARIAEAGLAAVVHPSRPPKTADPSEIASHPAPTAPAGLAARLTPWLRHVRFVLNATVACLRKPSRAWATDTFGDLSLSLREPSLDDFGDPHDQRWLQAVVREARPEVVLVQYLRLSWSIGAVNVALDRTHRPRFVLDTHDVQHERRRRFHAAGQAHDIKVTRSQEVLALRRFDLVLAIQGRDQALLSTMTAPGRVIVAMHPVQAAVQPRPPREPGPLRLLFFGSDMGPNVEAATHLLRRLMPAASQRAPGQLRFTVAGSVCSALPPQGASAEVRMLGFVNDLSALMAAHDVMVAPIFTGGGLKIKIVEALASGLPVLTSPLGAEGIESAQGEGLVIAVGDDAFVETLATWAADLALLPPQGERARAWVARHLGNEQVFGALDRFLCAEP